MNEAVVNELSSRLEALATEEAEHRTQKQVRTLRGIRGVPGPALAQVIHDAASRGPFRHDTLAAMFGVAWEDGLVAIGLLSLSVAKNPHDALATGLEWAERTDDILTADALGWLVLGPAALAIGRSGGTGSLRPVLSLRTHHRPEARRAAVSAGLAFTPEPISGPSAAALKATQGRDLAFVASSVDDALAVLCSRFVRDTAPLVQKALRRVLVAWAASNPRAVVAWAAAVPGGIPKLLGAVAADARKGMGR